jgi:RecA-family ATPase
LFPTDKEDDTAIPIVFQLPQNPIPTLEEIGERITDPISEGPVDIIPGLLPRRNQILIAGETNIGKSLVTLEIVSALVKGNPLWGEEALTPTMTAKKVLYILGEHDNDTIRKLWRATRLPMSDEVYIIGPDQLSTDKYLISRGEVNEHVVAKYKKWVEGCDLVIWDPFSAFISGTDVENDNIQMRTLLDQMSHISRSAGASSIVLAHQGKPMMDKTGVEHSRTRYATRGASAIEDAATNIFYLSGARSGESEAAMKATNSMIFSLSCRKYKGETPPEYRLLRDKATLTHTLLGDRPFVDVRRIEVQAEYARLTIAFPTMKKTDCYRAIAAVRGISDQTVRRYLEGA